MEQFDTLKECTRCGGDACYTVEKTVEIKTEFCLGCGFQTNSLMKVGSEFLDEQLNESLISELHKVLMDEDEEGKVWMPSHTDAEGQGVVTIEGTGRDNWAWSAYKYVPTTEEDTELVKAKPFKPDVESKRYFKEKDFMEALSYIGVLPNGEEE